MERETVELSFIALAGCWRTEPEKVVEDVAGLTEEMFPRQEIVWGPAVHQPRPELIDADSKRTDALVFISRDRDSGDYFVVFRGTNTVSATEWLLQDFMVRDQVPWSEIQGSSAPKDALVSDGTAKAVRLRLELRPEGGALAGESLGDALVGLIESSKGPCVMHFTGHSLGGLLAPVMALWLEDRLEELGRADLRGKLRLDVYGYAAPTAGNEAFASYLHSRLASNTRYANPLDIVPLAWAKDSFESMPTLYAPLIEMGPYVHSFYDLCKAIARDKGYAHPGPCVAVPAKVVPTRGDLYLLEVAYQHLVPYLDILDPERKAKILGEVIEPLAASVQVKGIPQIDLEDLYRVPAK
jgi:Lipase (class 3).